MWNTKNHRVTPHCKENGILLDWKNKTEGVNYESGRTMSRPVLKRTHTLDEDIVPICHENRHRNFHNAQLFVRDFPSREFP